MSEERTKYTTVRPCDKAPEGWCCNRERGHEGPCSPIPLPVTKGSGDFYYQAMKSTPHIFFSYEEDRNGPPETNLTWLSADRRLMIDVPGRPSLMVRRWGPLDRRKIEEIENPTVEDVYKALLWLRGEDGKNG